VDLGRVALQLYTVREYTSLGMIDTLSKLADIGYTAFEFAGYGDSTPDKIRKALDDLGVSSMGAHVQLADIEAHPQRILEDLNLLGCRYAIIPAIPPERRKDKDSVLRLADKFNEWASWAKEASLSFGYHNHDFEFARFDGTSLWDILVERTEPSLVALELDVFWAYEASFHPAKLISDHADRIALVHLKDKAPARPNLDVPVGDGVLPWSRILDACTAAEVQWYVVEQDYPQDTLEEVRRSLRYLEQL
jgi:sugar phosphate isomerase/epimerase